MKSNDILKTFNVAEMMHESGFSPEGKNREWALVLDAIGIPYLIRDGQLRVSSYSAERAYENILAYERENAVDRQEIHLKEVPLPWSENFLVLGALLLFFSFVHSGTDIFAIREIQWTQSGAGDSAGIVSGQWWLGITSLTLHADPAHVMGNVLFGAPFVVLVCSRLGFGLGWASVIFSGWMGNMINAYVRGPGFVSIGFSTAVFAAAGIMVTIFQRKRKIKNFLDAVVMALALLALLGAGGENTDLGAHFWGLLSGIGVGAILRFQPLPLPPPKVISAFLGTATFLIFIGAWAIALR